MKRRPENYGSKARYGFDAPAIMWSLIGGGSGAFLTGLAAHVYLTGWLSSAGAALLCLAVIPLCLGLSMLTYGLIGKRRMRDFIMSRIAWRGDEQVLDVGTGLGLLLIAAAKKLGPGGRAKGVDIWRVEDLSGGGLDQLAHNIALEGVEERVGLYTEDARKLPFPDQSFDVVFSLFCIHNIEGKAAQGQALLEIVRVLKPGGRVLIGEWLPVGDYARVLQNSGLRIRSCRSHFRTALALMWMVDAEKPA